MANKEIKKTKTSEEIQKEKSGYAFTMIEKIINHPLNGLKEHKIYSEVDAYANPESHTGIRGVVKTATGAFGAATSVVFGRDVFGRINARLNQRKDDKAIRDGIKMAKNDDGKIDQKEIDNIVGDGVRIDKTQKSYAKHGLCLGIQGNLTEEPELEV